MKKLSRYLRHIHSNTVTLSGVTSPTRWDYVVFCCVSTLRDWYNMVHLQLSGFSAIGASILVLIKDKFPVIRREVIIGVHDLRSSPNNSNPLFLFSSILFSILRTFSENFLSVITIVFIPVLISTTSTYGEPSIFRNLYTTTTTMLIFSFCFVFIGFLFVARRTFSRYISGILPFSSTNKARNIRSNLVFYSIFVFMVIFSGFQAAPFLFSVASSGLFYLCYFSFFIFSKAVPSLFGTLSFEFSVPLWVSFRPLAGFLDYLFFVFFVVFFVVARKAKSAMRGSSGCHAPLTDKNTSCFSHENIVT